MRPKGYSAAVPIGRSVPDGERDQDGLRPRLRTNLSTIQQFLRVEAGQLFRAVRSCFCAWAIASSSRAYLYSLN
jgi:hypothetical protein